MQQINTIREKAAEAEAIVKGITQDIQKLDVAKRNLTGAIQTLERWGMLRKSSKPCVAGLTCPRGSTRSTQGALANEEVQGDVASACRQFFHRRPPSIDQKQAVMQLLGPLKPLATVMTVAEVFKAAEQDRQKVQEKVSAEIETL